MNVGFKQYPLVFIAAFALAVGLNACASMGSPDGGRYDEEPPRVVSSTPLSGSVNAGVKKINIRFNEFIKLENASEKVIVSPPQSEMPNISAEGKSVKITLYDSLRANTTYTVDFSDAIVDNNEGNPMGKYTFSFSTGPTIDTMEVSGTVLNAENLEPVKGILVGLYPADSTWADSLFRTQPFLRVGRTNGLGQFSIKGVRPGRYRAHALQDMDGNNIFSQKAEALAWDTTAFETSQRPDLRPDTVWLDTAHIDRIRMVPYIHYFPDNIVLRSFLEEGQDQHLLKHERKGPYSMTFFFTAPQDSLPRIEADDFDAGRSLLVEASARRDTITYWITDTALAHRDTLQMRITYPDTDTTGVAVPRTDTLSIVPRMSYARMQQDLLKKSEEWQKEQDKKRRRARGKFVESENPYAQTFLQPLLRPGASIAPNGNFTYEFTEPIAHVDSSKLHLSIKKDSLYLPVPFLLVPDPATKRRFTLYAEWEPGAAYRFEADSLAFISYFGHPTRSIVNDLRVRPEDDFGSIFVRLTGGDGDADTSRVVQLLDSGDKVVAEQRARDARADFFYLKGGKYYLRLFVDRNGNGKWDTGNYDARQQPEEVFYFPQPIPLKERFDVEQSWDYRAIPLTQQKPAAITKQKADKQKSIRARNRERDEEMKRNSKKR